MKIQILLKKCFHLYFSPLEAYTTVEIKPLGRTSESLQWNYKPPGIITESLQWNYNPPGRISESLQLSHKPLGKIYSVSLQWNYNHCRYRISESFQWNFKPFGRITESLQWNYNLQEGYLNPSCGIINHLEG